jgi:hypothetical protein
MEHDEQKHKGRDTKSIGRVANQHGGPRTGAGRKPRGDQPRVMVSVRLPAPMVAYLATLDKTELIETSIAKTKGYKTWLKAN